MRSSDRGHGGRNVFLQSQVARRLFAVFAACALIPVLAFSMFSYDSVGRQLERDALKDLRRSSKAAGMGILERLLLADHEIRLLTQKDRGGVGEASRALVSLQSLPGTDPRLQGLAPAQRRHLERGGALLWVSEGSGRPSVHLVRYRDSLDPAEGAWLAEIAAEYLLAGERQPGGGHLWVSTASGAVLHASEASGPLPPGSRGGEEASGGADADSLVGSWEIFLGSLFQAPSWVVTLSLPLETVYGPLQEFEKVFPWVAGATLFAALALTMSWIRRTLDPIESLTRGARAMAGGNFDTRVEVASSDEFGALSGAFNEMAEKIEGHVRLLSLVNDLGTVLSAEDDTERLIELLLRGSMEATGARVGALFLTDAGSRQRLSRAQLSKGRLSSDRKLEDLLPTGIAERALTDSSPARVHRASSLDDVERARWIPLEVEVDEPLVAYLMAPLRDERRQDLGVLLLIRMGERHFSQEDCQLAESLASQAAVAVRKNQLVDSYRGLFEGLIDLTVGAIDEKSAYTADHCRNVPIITELLADAVCSDAVGAFKDFDLTAEERYELRIAALLHDCGKVVTPVHVMDKATKLETIHDRIHLVETRFELLRREARIRALCRTLEAVGAEAVQDPILDRELAKLDEDMAFLRERNLGSEGLAEEDRSRLLEIAGSHPWTDREGTRRLALSEEELDNLLVERGTLTAEERGVIEYHVVATMNLLERLPFPRELRGVPAIAGAHHERLDGTGYPLQLRGEQLSVQARILGLADVFEALTASDRPYKPGNTLRETLRLLEEMREQGHIDGDLLDVFVRDKLHLRYAIGHLKPEQIDPEFQPELEELTGP